MEGSVDDRRDWPRDGAGRVPRVDRRSERHSVSRIGQPADRVELEGRAGEITEAVVGRRRRARGDLPSPALREESREAGARFGGISWDELRCARGTLMARGRGGPLTLTLSPACRGEGERGECAARHIGCRGGGSAGRAGGWGERSKYGGKVWHVAHCVAAAGGGGQRDTPVPCNVPRGTSRLARERGAAGNEEGVSRCAARHIRCRDGGNCGRAGSSAKGPVPE